MARYLALIDYDAQAQAFGVVFPDVPGCTAMGATFDEAHANGVEALREWAADHVGAGQELPAARDAAALRADRRLDDEFTSTAVLVSVPVFLDGMRSVRINISMEAALVAEIDEAAKVRGLTRSAFLASAARDKMAAR